MTGEIGSARDDPDAQPVLPRSADPVTITALTGVRALAAAWVLAGHLRHDMYDLLPVTRVLDPLLMRGFLGVDVFFVLSGFVISHNYVERLGTRRDGRVREFLLARFARLYPVHVLTLVAASLLALVAVDASARAGAQQGVGGFVGNLLLLQAVPGVEAVNGPAWSISCEAAAYLVFPLLAGVLARLGSRGAAGLVGLVVITQIAALVILDAGAPSGADFWGFSVWVRIAFEFPLGALLWVVWRHRPVRGHLGDALAVGSVALTVAALWVLPSLRSSMLVVPLLASFVVAAACSAGPVRWLLASRPMQWGGRVSYSLYLTHFIVLAILAAVVPTDGLRGDSLAVRVGAVAVAVAACLAVAALTHRIVEEPARRRVRGLGSPLPATPQPRAADGAVRS